MLLKDEPPKYTDFGEDKRISEAVKFIGDCSGTILSIGKESDYDSKIAEHFNLGIIFTKGDLDYPDWTPYCSNRLVFDNVFCFEIIEHLINPLTFFVTLKRFITKDTDIYVSHPSRNSKYWSDHHWHEMDQERFMTLAEKANYRVVKSTWHYAYRAKWYQYFWGLRPLFRLLTFHWIRAMQKRHYYLLRLK